MSLQFTRTYRYSLSRLLGTKSYSCMHMSRWYCWFSLPRHEKQLEKVKSNGVKAVKD